MTEENPQETDPENLHSLSTLSEIAAALAKIRNSTDNDPWHRILALYRRAQSIPATNHEELRRFLVEELGTDCMRDTQTNTDSGLSMHLRGLRNILSEWLDALPDELLWRIRASLIDIVYSELSQSPSVEKLYLIPAIGYRCAQFAKALKMIAERDDAVGELASRLLASGFVNDDDLPWLQEHIEQRLLTKRDSSELRNAAAHLGGEWAVHLLTKVSASTSPGEWWQFGRFAWIATERPGDQHFQDGVWNAVVGLADERPNGWGELMFSGGVMQSIRTPKVRSILGNRLNFLVHAVPLLRLGHQIADFFIPEHVQILDRDRGDADISPLRPAATQSSGPSTPSYTENGLAKKHAWDAALFFGSRDWYGWINDAINLEENPYRQYSLMEQLSVFSLPELPSMAARLLSDRDLAFQHGEAGPQILVFLAAARLAASCLSMDSLKLLLQSSGLVDGHPLRSVVTGAAELALWLFQTGSNEVIPLLISSLALGCTPMEKNTAILGLRYIALQWDSDESPNHVIDALRKVVIFGDDLPYVRAEAILAISAFNNDLDEVLTDELAALCCHESEMLRVAAAQALLRCEDLKRFRKPIESCIYFGIDRSEFDRDHLPAGLTDPQASIIGRLARADPATYANQMRIILRDSYVVACSQVLNGYIAAGREGSPVDSNISDAIVARVYRGETFSDTTPFVLDALSTLDPARFLGEPWDRAWKRWMPESRIAILRGAAEANSRLQGTRRGTVARIAEVLLGDSSFMVRRMAARVLSELDLARLATICHEWLASGAIQLKARAAELSSWLPPDDPLTDDNEIQRRLMRDAERRVRTAAEEGRKDAQRRRAADFHLRAMQIPIDNPNEWVHTRFSHGVALTLSGDDGHLALLEEWSRKTELPPNVRHWASEVAGSLEKKWKDSTRKWPKPWLPWKGRIESILGSIVMEAREYPAELFLWMCLSESDEERGTWGGIARLEGASLSFSPVLLNDSSSAVAIRISGRGDAKAMVVRLHGSEVTLIGWGQYPFLAR